MEITGEFNTAKIFIDVVDSKAYSQIQTLLNQPIFKDEKIRIMPDVHAGVGCTIGTTMTITDKVIPNLVGVDIGCGMHVVTLYNNSIDFKKLDNFIRNNIPSGRNVQQQ